MELIRVLLLLATAGVATNVLAVESPSVARFANGKLLVVDARHYLSDPVVAFKSNQQLTFTRRQMNPPEVDSKPVSVRIFSLHPGEKVPTPWAAFEPCWVYLSTLLQVQVNPSSTINLFTLTKEWLTAVKGEPMKAAQYLLVFEQGGGDDHGLFRLNGGDQADYFRRGLLVEVTPSRSFSQAEVDLQAENEKANRAKVLAAARINDPKSTCYITRVASIGTIDEEPSILALNEGCDTAMLTH